jgi:Tol biopolymer transport system component
LNQTATYEGWLADTSRAALRRLIAFPSADAASIMWSPDGESVVYVREGLVDSDGIYLQRVDGASEPRKISGNFNDGFMTPVSWLPDASGLIITRGLMGAGRDLFILPVGKDGPPLPLRPLRVTPHEDDDGVVSPDGRLIAFSSTESGRKEVYVAEYNNGSVGPPLVVSDGACGRSQWAGPRRLIYCALPVSLMSVDITVGPALSASRPVMLHDLQKFRIHPTGWSIRPDGRVLAIQRSEGEFSVDSMNMILHWGQDVRKRLTKK